MIRVVAVLGVLTAAPAFAQSAAQLDANKQVVFEFYKYWPADPEKAASLFTEDHVEHAPRFVKYCGERGITGKACFLETIRSGAFGNLGRGGGAGRAGGAPGGRGAFAPRAPDLVTAEKDLVTFIFRRQLPDPEAPGRTYDAWSFDTFRIRDGKIAEHWDSATLAPPPGAATVPPATVPAAQAGDEARIRQIIASQSDGWNRGSVEDYTARFKEQGVYTIIIGTTYQTRSALQERVRGILTSIFKGSRITQDVRSVHFLAPTVAVVDAQAEMTGFTALPAGIQGSPDGRLRTSMLQVLTKENGDWWVSAWHNVELVP